MFGELHGPQPHRLDPGGLHQPRRHKLLLDLNLKIPRRLLVIHPIINHLPVDNVITAAPLQHNERPRLPHHDAPRHLAFLAHKPLLPQRPIILGSAPRHHNRHVLKIPETLLHRRLEMLHVLLQHEGHRGRVELRGEAQSVHEGHGQETHHPEDLGQAARESYSDVECEDAFGVGEDAGVCG